MKIIPPINVTPDVLTSNVDITETEWTAGTYSTETRRYVGVDLYEVVAEPSTSDDPVTGAAKEIPTWIFAGTINRFKMFSFVIGDATKQEGGPIVTTLGLGRVVNAVAMFEVEAASVRVVMTDPLDGIVYDTEKVLSDESGVSNWYQYFFAPILRAREVIFADLPAYGSAEITITVDNGDGDTSVGELIMGATKTLGVTLQRFEFGIEDFSRKERDAFGNFVILERRFAKIASYDVFIENNLVGNAFRTLAAVRAVPVVYIGSEARPETVTLGFYKDFSTLRTGPISSEMSIEIEGLV